jgi:hypothetical protein
MAANRISRHRSPSSGASSPSAAAAPIPNGFVVCPLQLAAAQPWQQEIYRLAYERARAAVETPRHYRLLFSCWN